MNHSIILPLLVAVGGLLVEPPAPQANPLFKQYMEQREKAGADAKADPMARPSPEARPALASLDQGMSTMLNFGERNVWHCTGWTADGAFYTLSGGRLVFPYSKRKGISVVGPADRRGGISTLSLSNGQLFRLDNADASPRVTRLAGTGKWIPVEALPPLTYAKGLWVSPDLDPWIVGVTLRNEKSQVHASVLATRLEGGRIRERLEYPYAYHHPMAQRHLWENPMVWSLGDAFLSYHTRNGELLCARPDQKKVRRLRAPWPVLDRERFEKLPPHEQANCRFQVPRPESLELVQGSGGTVLLAQCWQPSGLEDSEFEKMSEAESKKVDLKRYLELRKEGKHWVRLYEIDPRWERLTLVESGYHPWPLLRDAKGQWVAQGQVLSQVK